MLSGSKGVSVGVGVGVGVSVGVGVEVSDTEGLGVAVPTLSVSCASPTHPVRRSSAAEPTMVVAMIFFIPPMYGVRAPLPGPVDLRASRW
ncbi:hypothetical protein C5E11_04660 [Clavibacter michiganensis]|nr:hypothetical protein C5E11_04660 [Clavibacter michiganensis]